MCTISKKTLGLWWQLFMGRVRSWSVWKTVQFSLWLVYFWFEKLVLLVFYALAGMRSMVCTELH